MGREIAGTGQVLECCAKENLKALRALYQDGRDLEVNWHGRLETLALAVSGWLERLEQLANDMEVILLKDVVRKFASHRPELLSRHSLACALVAIERILQRAVTDDQFLVFTGDGRREHHHGDTDLVIVCENMRSAFNVGSMMRTADCLGATQVVLAGYTSTPDHPKVRKTAMGADGHVSWRSASDGLAAILALKAEGYAIIGLETACGASLYHGFDFPRKTVIVLGNERYGLNPETILACDSLVYLPTLGVKNSLNVATALAVCGYEYLRQRRSN